MTRALVVVDPGHGGSDPGAENPRTLIWESELNLDFALMFQLWARTAFDVLLTRTRDEAVSLQARAILSNERRADVFLSFHCNAAEDEAAHGFEVWTSPGQTKADSLATAIFGALAKACPGKTGRTDYDDGDPDKETRFYVLRTTAAPAVLIEFGFVSNDAESSWLNDVLNQGRIAEALVLAVKGWLGGR